LGDTLEVHGANWKVVGIFDSNGDAHESEVWTGYQDVADVWQRPTWSSILLRVDSADSARKMAERISEDRALYSIQWVVGHGRPDARLVVALKQQRMSRGFERLLVCLLFR